MPETNRITVDTKAFTRELEWCARFIERKASIPVLTNVLFQKRGDLLHLTGTDLEIGGITSVEVSGEGPDFELTVPVHLLVKYLKKIDERAVSLLPDIAWTPLCEGPHPEDCKDDACRCDLKQEIISVALRLKHGDDGSMNVGGLPASQYPELPSRPLATCELTGLESAIPRALISISNDESRFTLNGALLVVKGHQARLISTDGHRLSAVDLKSHDYAKHIKTLIPRKALSELQRLGDSAFFCADKEHAFFAVGVRVIVARKLTGNFPDYERVLPPGLPYAADVSVAPFRKVLDRVALFADERSHAVMLTVNGALNLSAKTHEQGAEGKVLIDCVRRLDGENGYDPLPNGLAYPYAAGFNACYLADFLKAAGVPDVRFLFHKCAAAAEWSAPGWRYILMPMRGMGESDPCAVGDSEMLQWAKDEAYVPAPIEDAYKHLPACSGCGCRTVNECRVCDVCALAAAESSPEPVAVESVASDAIPAVPDAPVPVAVADTIASDDMLDAVGAALLLGIHQATIYIRVKAGKMPPAVKVGRRMMWNRAVLEALKAA